MLKKILLCSVILTSAFSMPTQAMDTPKEADHHVSAPPRVVIPENGDVSPQLLEQLEQLPQNSRVIMKDEEFVLSVKGNSIRPISLKKDAKGWYCIQIRASIDETFSLLLTKPKQ